MGVDHSGIHILVAEHGHSSREALKFAAMFDLFGNRHLDLCNDIIECQDNHIHAARMTL